MSSSDPAELLVLTHRNQLDTTRLDGKVVIVLDVVFATSSMIAAFAQGIRACIPAPDEAAARPWAEDGRDVVIAGEKDAVVPEGFAHFAPLKLAAHELADRTLVFCSTNGAPALTMAARGPHVYAGALLNRRALCSHLVAEHADHGLILMCAGSGGGFCLEDFFGAGAYIAELQRLGGAWSFTDSAMAAVAAYRQYDVAQAVAGSRVGRWMSRLGLDEDLRYCAQFDVIDLVPRMHGERLLVASR